MWFLKHVGERCVVIQSVLFSVSDFFMRLVETDCQRSKALIGDGCKQGMSSAEVKDRAGENRQTHLSLILHSGVRSHVYVWCMYLSVHT